MKKELKRLLSRQCQLDAKVRSITKILPNLQIVRSDAVQLSEMISFASTLAENVSAKVRQLDIARVSIIKIMFYKILCSNYVIFKILSACSTVQE